MKNGFVINNDEFEILGASQISIGQGIEVNQRFAYDYSHIPQSISFRKRRTARTANLTVNINRSIVSNLFAEKDRYEGICGKIGDLWWNDEYIGQFLIKSVQFSIATDPIDIYAGLQIGIEMKEAYVETKSKSSVPKNIYLL